MKHRTSWIIAVVVLIVVGIAAALAYVSWNQKEAKQTATEQTGHSDSPPSQTETSELGTRQYTSVKGVTIELNDWPKDGVVSNPLTITGKVPGNWSFEGSFPIDLVYEGDIGLPGTTAKLQGDWMTTEMVPFKATLSVDKSNLAGHTATIILRNANPSDLPENADSLSLNVRFSQ